jgi:hypothetical protein
MGDIITSGQISFSCADNRNIVTKIEKRTLYQSFSSFHIPANVVDVSVRM